MAKQQARSTKPRSVLKLKITGPDVRSGRIPIPDLIVICQQAQSAIDRQAEALEGKRTLRPGPTIDKVRHECTLDLVSLEKGSAVLGFDQAQPQQDLPAMRGLGMDAVSKVAGAIASLGRDGNAEIDPGVLDSLNKMGELLHNGVDAIEWIVPAQPGHRLVRARFTKTVHQRIAARLKPPKKTDTTVDGILEMADFKPAEQRCRIHPPLGPPINCTFNPDLADSVYDVLRQAARIEGKATVNAETGRTESIEIRSVQPLDPLTVNAGSFFRGWTFDQLVHMQAVGPLRDLRDLAGVWPPDDDVDDALTEIYRHRD